MTDLIGKSLGPYQILGEIGRGGMAVVYEAYHPMLARRVAIKVLLPHLAADAALVRRFLQEARSAASLSHPNVVTIYDVVEQGGQYYIVMQRLPGLPLNQLIRQAGVLPLPRAAAITGQIAAALDYAHRSKLVHRDVKPANIIVGPDDHAVLTDFGVARAVEASSLTSFGTVIGTPEYMSPEQAKGETVGPASDLYALGIVLYEMLSGRVPFRAPNTPALLFKQVYEPLPPVRTHVPELAEGVDGVLARALAKQPGERFATGGELAQALQVLAPVRGAISTPSRLPTPAPADVKSRSIRLPAPASGGARPAQARPAAGLPGWLLPLMGVLIVALLVAVVALWPRSSPEPASPQPVAVVAVSPTPDMPLLAPATSTLSAATETRPAATPAAPGQASATSVPAITPTGAGGVSEPTSTLAPGVTRVPPTATPSVVATRGTAPTPIADQRGRTLPPPVPQQPNGGDQPGPQIVFTWLPGAHALSNTEGYAVLVWSPDKQGAGGDLDLSLPSPGDFCKERLAGTQYSMPAETLQQPTWGGTGSFRWTVVIVDTKQVDANGRCAVVSQKGDVLTFRYVSTGSSCQPPAGGCPARTSWDQASCSCK